MPANDVEVVYVNGVWVVRRQVSHTVAGQYRLKSVAVTVARAVARMLGVEVIVKKRDGRIGWRNTYTGHDPRRSKG